MRQIKNSVNREQLAMSFYTFEVRNIKPVPIPVILPKTNNINDKE